jgi:hypothetical protein
LLAILSYCTYNIYTIYYILLYQIEKNEMDGAGSTCDRLGTYWVLVEKPGGIRPLGRQRHRRESNIKMDLQDVGWRVMEWIYLAQERVRWWALLNAVMNLRVP